jgi:hypothetical protein
VTAAESPRHGTLAGYHLDGCRCDACTAAATRYEKQRHLDALSAGPRTVPTVGPLRMVQALAVAGFPLRAVAAQLGMPIGRLHRTVHGKRMNAAEAAALAVVYRRLHSSDPTRHGVLSAHAARVSRTARAKGWAGPEAWEIADIDDPDASPDPPGSYCPQRSYEEIAEDALFVLATAGPMDRAAVACRLGVQVRTLDRAFASMREHAAT